MASPSTSRPISKSHSSSTDPSAFLQLRDSGDLFQPCRGIDLVRLRVGLQRLIELVLLLVYESEPLEHLGAARHQFAGLGIGLLGLTVVLFEQQGLAHVVIDEAVLGRVLLRLAEESERALVLIGVKRGDPLFEIGFSRNSAVTLWPGRRASAFSSAWSASS